MSVAASLKIKDFQQVAPYLVLALITFLGGTSQWLFASLDPHPLRPGQTIKFNALIASLLICYYRSCTVDPGRISRTWDQRTGDEALKLLKRDASQDDLEARRRRCRKCDMLKPQRAHHCKSCGRCIPKMDHHCPWTANCVSYRTMPHFVRFLFYATSALAYLQYLIIIRLHALWQKRALPSYLGPSVLKLSHLFLLAPSTFLTFFSLLILLLSTLRSLLTNTTTIESWEISRHHVLLRRARASPDRHLDGPDGRRVRLVRQEFPFDLGFLPNLVQAFGSANPLVWFWPLARSLPSGVEGEGTGTAEVGTEWPTNGFEDPGTVWPPPDPDRLFVVARVESGPPVGGDAAGMLSLDPVEFRSRQLRDSLMRRRKPYHARWEGRTGTAAGDVGRDSVGDGGGGESEDDDDDDDEDDEYGTEGDDGLASPGRPRTGVVVDDDDDDDGHGEEAWRNGDGERLADFGLDEDVEFYDEDDLPLAELLRRRKAARAE